jgi:hypothetical protein
MIPTPTNPNIQGNTDHPFHGRLKQIRENARWRANERAQSTGSPDLPDTWLKICLANPDLDEAIRKPAQEAVRLTELSPEASIQFARTALLALIKQVGVRDSDRRDYLERAIRKMQDDGKISEVTAHEMHTIQRIRNAVEFKQGKVTSHDARACGFALMAILRAVHRPKKH